MSFKAIAIAVINGAGNLGGILASFVYIQPSSFHIGYIANIASLSVT
jgi:hypothetical protein